MGVQLPSEPITRKEQYLAKIAGQAVEIPAEPLTREEAYLNEIAKNGSGGGGGTTNYNLLSNKPQIAGTELQGNKSLADLGIASAQSVSNITNGESINNFAGVETALSNKQNALTAGDYIAISNGEISVDPVVPNDVVSYEFKTKDTSGANAAVTIIKRSNGEVVSSTDYHHQQVNNRYITIDDTFYFGYNSSLAAGWAYKLIVASDDHSVNFVKNWGYDANVDYTETYTTDHSGESLVTKGDMNDALATKQDTLTFDDTPTDNSNNPVKSNGIYDALATKADTDMVAADFNAGTSYTAGNYCVQDGKLYKFKNNHSGTWSSADVDEVKITGELSALKSGLTNVIRRKNLPIQTATIGSDFENVVSISDLANNGYLEFALSYGGYYYICRFSSSNAYQKSNVTSAITLELELTSTYVRLKLVGATASGTVSKVTQDYV